MGRRTRSSRATRPRSIKLAATFEADGVQVKPLNVSHAFHSPLMDEMLDEFEAFASRIEYHKPRVPLAANLTGQLMTEAPTARYWRDHLRNTVQFAEDMNRIAEAQADDDHRDRPVGKLARHGPHVACRSWKPRGCRRCAKARTIGPCSPAA